ncbi:MAG: hypothetical protein WCN88_04655 [Candidatus Falkowbacteria bacterium]
MKKHFFKLLLIAILVLIPFGLVKAETLSKKLSGKILLQVESHGEAWYVNPTDANRYYMADGSAAYNVMRNFGVGITNNNLTKFQNNKNLAKKQSGKIFLQVEDKGQAYYVNSDGTLYYLKNGDAAYGIMRNLGLGITNTNLSKISEATSSPSQISQDNQDSQYTIPQTTATTTLTCSSNWQCGSWSNCADSQQTRFCNDLNSCSIENQKPATTQTCSMLIPTPICTPNWQCTAWNSCLNSQQTRTCNDSKNCGIATEKPNEIRTCSLDISTSTETVDIPPSLSLQPLGVGYQFSGQTFPANFIQPQPLQTSVTLASFIPQYNSPSSYQYFAVDPTSLVYEVISSDFTKSDLSISVRQSAICLANDCARLVLDAIPSKGGKFQIKIIDLKFYKANGEKSALGLPLTTVQYEVRDPNFITLFNNNQKVSSGFVYVGGHTQGLLQMDWTGTEPNSGWPEFYYKYAPCNDANTSFDCLQSSGYIPIGRSASVSIPFTSGYSYENIELGIPLQGILNASLILQ